MQVKKLSLELDVEQQTGSKLGKEYFKTAYLTYVQSAWWEMLEWIKLKLESWGRNINNLRYARSRDPYGRKQRKTKEPLDADGGGEWKSWLKTQHSKS